MKHLVLAAGVLLALATSADASDVKIRPKRVSISTVISAQTGSSAGWTGWIRAVDYVGIAFEAAHTNNAATAITMRCEVDSDSDTANDAGFDIHSISVASGTATSSALTWSNAVSGNESWVWVVDDIPGDYLNCAFTQTSGDGSDSLTVVAWGVSP